MDLKQVHIPEEPQVNTTPDILTLVLAFLGALKVLLAAPPFNIEIPNETFDAFLNLVGILFAGFGIWKNTYTTKRAQKQKAVLEQTGLKDRQ